MALAAGSRVGPYEILEPAGAGGMGEVYRARDTRLDRTVAIKLLPPARGADRGLRERFEREARVVATLSHPHICTLYDVGEHDGAPYIVMEFLEGETLAQRLERRGGTGSRSGTRSLTELVGSGSSSGRGGLPVDQALAIAIEIAEALEFAHRAGVVHRDLKPANVVLTRTGVKVVDFGLARVGVPATKTTGEFDAAARSALETKVELTKEATVLGTLPYMAPEQVEGREADGRSDIFAFGSVLYEMLTGRRAFAAQSEASLIAAILEHEPVPLSSVRPVAPAIERIVSVCLAKDPDDRWQSAGDLRRELAWVLAGGSNVDVPVSPGARKRRNLLVAMLACATFVVGAATAWWGASLRGRPAPRILRLQLPVTGLATVSDLAVSPDGRQVAFAVSERGSAPSKLQVRSLDSLQSRLLAGTDGAMQPFWSPDAAQVGFMANGTIRRVDLASGAVQTICRVPGESQGASWTPAGEIWFASVPGGLQRVPASGGEPAVVLDGKAPHTSLATPRVMRDGRRFLVASLSSRLDRPGIYRGEVGSDLLTFVADAGSFDLTTDALFSWRDGALLVQRFDDVAGVPRGQPMQIADDVARHQTGVGAFSPSTVGGVVAYRRNGRNVDRLTWLDRNGAELGHVSSEISVGPQFALAPDDRRVLVTRPEPKTGAAGLWLIDDARDGVSMLASAPGHRLVDPVWSPDGRTIAYGREVPSTDPGDPTANPVVIETRATDVAGEGTRVLEPEAPDSYVFPEDWSRDSRWLAFVTWRWANGVMTHRGGVLELGTKAKPTIFGEIGGHLDELRFSPDGKWLAYHDNRSGRFEVYVSSVPPSSRRWQLSTAGGSHARFSPDGREIYYIAPDATLMTVTIKVAAGGLEAGVPKPLFKLPIDRISFGTDVYTVASDGRFLVGAVVQSSRDVPMDVVVNWPSVLSGPNR